MKTLRNVKVKYIACGEDFSVFLTLDGGVFTCGSGRYGQLGHGSTSDEILPRMVKYFHDFNSFVVDYFFFIGI